jgi:hypothetical protein
MNRETAQAIWYRRLDRDCFTTEPTDDNTFDTTATEQMYTATAPRWGRWFPRFTATSASEEWRPLAEERRRWAVEATGDSAY